MSDRPTVASLSADLARFQAMFAAIQAEVAALRGENTTLTTDLGALRTENASLTQNLTTLRTENTTAQAVAAAAAQQLQVTQATANQAAANTAAALAAAQQGQAQPVQAGGGGGGGGNAVRFPAMFAATPAMVDHEQIIDYKTKTGVMVYDEGCKALTTPFKIETKPSPPTPLRLSFYISAWNFRPTYRTRLLPEVTDMRAQTFKMKHVPARQYFHVVVLIEIILTYCAKLLSC
jgi:hypothetical protein